MAIREKELQDLLGRFVVDVGAGFHAVNAVVGDRLGLYRALNAVMPASADQVAAEAGVDERYVRGWRALGSRQAGLAQRILRAPFGAGLGANAHA